MSESTENTTQLINSISALVSRIDDFIEMVDCRTNCQLQNQYEIEYTRCRQGVKKIEYTSKSLQYEIFMPSKLHITDFTQNIQVYENRFLVETKDVISPIFILENKTGRYDLNELLVSFYKHDQTNVITYMNSSQGRDINDNQRNFILAPDTYVKEIILKSTQYVYIPTGLKIIAPWNMHFRTASPRDFKYTNLIVLDQSIGPYDLNQIYISIVNGHKNTVRIIADQPLAILTPHIMSNKDGILIQKDF